MKAETISISIAAASFGLSVIAIGLGRFDRLKARNRDEFSNSVRYVVDSVRQELEQISDDFKVLADCVRRGAPRADIETLYTRFIRIQRKTNRRVNDIAALDITDASNWINIDEEAFDRSALSLEKIRDGAEDAFVADASENISRALEGYSRQLGRALDIERRKH